MSEPAPGAPDDLVLSIRDVRAQPSEEPGELALEIDTTRGTILAALRPVEGKTGCAVFLGGAMGGGDGPAEGVYLRLSRELTAVGVTSLRVGYRHPGEFDECVLDALAACSFLRGIGAERAVIVGHSFGGAVAIKAGELAPLAIAVAALSPQRFGTQTVERLARPLLLIHGSDDTVLLPQASEDIYERAQQPKRLVILEGGGHSLREVAAAVHTLLTEFITDAAGDVEEPE
ncbi:MAG: alpha/beta hydrolase [Chloroflexi bacterium]|nr:alpha/beta hydrolase [Chloroflexota bacterium]